MSTTLGRKVAKGVAWTFGYSVIVRLTQLLAMVVLARLLVPSQFGVFAIGSMIVTAIMLFRDLGLSEALLFYKEDLKENCDTTFLMSTAFGVLTWALMSLLAPLAADLFANRQIIWPLRIMGSTVLLSSLSLVPSALLERELEFKKRALPEIAMGLSHAGVAITLALLGFGVWSLVGGYVVSTAIHTLISWLLVDWRPSLRFSRASAQKVLSFGRPLMASSVLLLVFFYIDQAAVGRWLGVGVLGCYSMAFTICHLPATNISFVVNRVMYPAYSKLNDDLGSVRQAYMQAIRIIALVTFPISLGICLLSYDFITGFFGTKWLPAVPLIHILAFYGLFRSIGSTTDSVFMGLGKTKYIYRFNCLLIVLALPLLYPVVTRFRGEGVALLFTLSYLLGCSYSLSRVTRQLKVPLVRFLSLFAFPLVASLVVISGSFWLSRMLLPRGIPVTVGTVVMSVALYVGLVFRFDRESVASLRRMMGRDRTAD